VPIPKTIAARPLYGRNLWGNHVNIDAELRAIGYDPSMFSLEQKAAILAAMQPDVRGRRRFNRYGV